MKTGGLHSRVRLARAALITLCVAGLGGGALQLWPRPDDPAVGHAAAMRAAMEAVHHGKVDAAAMDRILRISQQIAEIHQGKLQSAAWRPDSDTPPDAGFMPASLTADDAQIRGYLSGRPAAAQPPRVAQLRAIPQPVTAPDDRANAGTGRCTACHRQEDSNWAHTVHARIFNLNPRDGMQVKGCEACHGDGSAHIKNPADLSTIISFSSKSKTPVAQQNAQCLGCHQGGPRIFWHGSIHETNRLACSDCHNPMTNFGSHGLTARESINQTCFSCHKVQRTEFNKRSHMPLLEGKLSCTDCHNPHGSSTAPLLKADSVNEVCYGCHAEKRGPFLFEHAPVQENCLNCHNPHGSNFESLLNAPRPLLCQQCHAQDGHPGQLMTMGNLPFGPRPDPRLIAASCQTCHVNIHGSNSPSGSRFER